VTFTNQALFVASSSHLTSIPRVQNPDVGQDQFTGRIESVIPACFWRESIFFRQMGVRQACPRMFLSGKPSGMTEAFNLFPL